jgi:hypothetical protein
VALHDRVGPEPLGKPFFVQWGWSSDGDWADGRNDERFASLDEARRRYGELKDVPDQPAWLGEIGDYAGKAGPIRDWLYFEWNAAAIVEWGQPSRRGQGLPYGTWTRDFVNYKPFGN